jgi:cyclohexanecarboxyl-CoA dehydrogenase
MEGFDCSRALLGILCRAVARKSLDQAWQYTRTRFTFGKALSEYHGVTFPLAEAETHMTGARLLFLQTLWLNDLGTSPTPQRQRCASGAGPS